MDALLRNYDVIAVGIQNIIQAFGGTSKSVEEVNLDLNEDLIGMTFLHAIFSTCVINLTITWRKLRNIKILEEVKLVLEISQGT